jgi:3-hexulose-6-phosphate synthase
MKLQLAMDRVSIEDAICIIEKTKGYVDIIEIGTSLIKDFGLQAITRIRKLFPNIVILADMKVMDEAEYECKAAYQAGADIVTVMGAAAISSLTICQKVAKEYNKDYMIDLLEVNDDKLKQIGVFHDALQCVHLPLDAKGNSLEKLLLDTKNKLDERTRIAVAGGVTLSNLSLLQQCHVDTVVVGGAITKAKDIRATAKLFYESMKEEV